MAGACNKNGACGNPHPCKMVRRAFEMKFVAPQHVLEAPRLQIMVADGNEHAIE
jgi:hypothetical protein